MCWDCVSGRTIFFRFFIFSDEDLKEMMVLPVALFPKEHEGSDLKTREQEKQILEISLVEDGFFGFMAHPHNFLSFRAAVESLWWWRP